MGEAFVVGDDALEVVTDASGRGEVKRVEGSELSGLEEGGLIEDVGTDGHECEGFQPLLGAGQGRGRVATSRPQGLRPQQVGGEEGIGMRVHPPTHRGGVRLGHHQLQQRGGVDVPGHSACVVAVGGEQLAQGWAATPALGDGRGQLGSSPGGGAGQPGGDERVETPRIAGHKSRYGTAPVGDLDHFPCGSPGHHGRRVLLQRPDADPFHVRHCST